MIKKLLCWLSWTIISGNNWLSSISILISILLFITLIASGIVKTLIHFSRPYYLIIFHLFIVIAGLIVISVFFTFLLPKKFKNRENPFIAIRDGKEKLKEFESRRIPSAREIEILSFLIKDTKKNFNSINLRKWMESYEDLENDYDKLKELDRKYKNIEKEKNKIKTEIKEIGKRIPKLKTKLTK